MTVINGDGVIRGFESSSFKLFAVTGWNVFFFLFPRPNCEHDVSDVSVRIFLCTTSIASLYESVITNYFINCLYIYIHLYYMIYISLFHNRIHKYWEVMI